MERTSVLCVMDGVVAGALPDVLMDAGADHVKSLIDPGKVLEKLSELESESRLNLIVCQATVHWRDDGLHLAEQLRGLGRHVLVLYQTHNNSEHLSVLEVGVCSEDNVEFVQKVRKVLEGE